MGLFEKIIMWRYRTQAISLRDVKVLFRAMHMYKQALIDGTAMPDLPTALTRRLRTMWIWAAFRVSVEQPTHFALGVVLSIPALGFLIYQFVIFIVQIIESQLASFAGN
jgi:hypothetical protein